MGASPSWKVPPWAVGPMGSEADVWRCLGRPSEPREERLPGPPGHLVWVRAWCVAGKKTEGTKHKGTMEAGQQASLCHLQECTASLPPGLDSLEHSDFVISPGMSRNG